MKYARTIAKSNGTGRLVLRYVRTMVRGEGKTNARNHIRKGEEKKKTSPPGKNIAASRISYDKSMREGSTRATYHRSMKKKKRKKKEMHCIVIRIDRPTYQTDAGWQRQKKSKKKNKKTKKGLSDII